MGWAPFEEANDYFKGCWTLRDHGLTVHVIKALGVDAYFTTCPVELQTEKGLYFRHTSRSLLEAMAWAHVEIEKAAESKKP